MDNNIIDKRTKGEWATVTDRVHIPTNEDIPIFLSSSGVCIASAKINPWSITPEEAKANAAFIVTACNEYDKLKEAAKLLEYLTPGGSEFSNDPQYCFDFIKKELHSIPSQVLPFKQRADKLKVINDSLLEALKELVDVCPCQNGCKENDMTCATQKAKEAIKNAAL